MRRFQYAQSASDLEKILNIQAKNHRDNLHPDEMAAQGLMGYFFVGVEVRCY